MPGTSCSNSGIRREYEKDRPQAERVQEGQVAAVLHSRKVISGRLQAFKQLPHRTHAPEEWPPPSHTALFGNGPIEDADVKELSSRLCRAGLPAAGGHRGVWTSFVVLAEQLVAVGTSKQDAMKGGLLRHPLFPRLRFTFGKMLGKLNDFRTRFAPCYFFIWSSMPDDALMKLARDWQIVQSRRASQRQTERMLKRPERRPPLADISPSVGRSFTNSGARNPRKEGLFGHYFRVKDVRISAGRCVPQRPTCKPMGRSATSSIPITRS